MTKQMNYTEGNEEQGVEILITYIPVLISFVIFEFLFLK
jgi:hypothetical protein